MSLLTSKNNWRWLSLVWMGLLIAGCNAPDSHADDTDFSVSMETTQPDQAKDHHGHTPASNHLNSAIRFNHDQLILTAQDHPDASISPQGELRIGHHAVTVSPLQQQLLQHYHAQAEILVQQSIGMVKVGAEVGSGVAVGVLRNLFNGNTNAASLNDSVQSHLRPLKQHIDGLCNQLAGLLSIQTQLTQQLPAFQPYASITEAQITACHQDTDSQPSMAMP